MNTLLELKKSFENGYITKPDFTEKMWQNGSAHLFKLKEYMNNNSLIKDITISKEGIIYELNSGVKLYAVEGDYGLIPFAIFNFGSYEEEIWEKTYKLFNKEPQTILDIGGNIGYFSLYFSKKFANSQFHCFEPIPNTFNYLQKNIILNNSQNIKCYNLGLSDKKQSIEMFYNPKGSGASSLRDICEKDYVKKVSCNFSTLDDFVKENNIKNIDFIKCDVEGAEKLVYEGGMETLAKYKPVIYSEMLRKWSAKFNYHPNDIINLLKTIGYECYAISSKTFYKIEKVTEETIETNYIFKQA